MAKIRLHSEFFHKLRLKNRPIQYEKIANNLKMTKNVEN